MAVFLGDVRASPRRRSCFHRKGSAMCVMAWVAGVCGTVAVTCSLLLAVTCSLLLAVGAL